MGESISLKKSLYGATCASVQPLLLNALSIPVMAYLIRQLGATGYGQWVVATTLVSFSAMLANLGLRASFIRALAREPNAAGTLLAEQLGLRLLLSSIATLAAVLACWSLGYSAVILQCTAIAGIGLIITTVAGTLADMLQALQRLPTLAAVNLIAGLALTAASVVAALLGGGPTLIALAYLVGPLISAAALVTIVRRRHCPVRVTWAGSRFVLMLKASRHFAAQQALAAASTQAETLLLPRLVGIVPFGFFSAGSLPAHRLAIFPDGLCAAAYPAIAQAWEENRSHATRLVLRYLLIGFVLSSAVALGSTLVAPPFARLLFPHQPELCLLVIRITIWSLPLMALEMVMGYALNAAGKDAAYARVSVPAAVASLVISVSMVTSMGATGACWSMLLRPIIRATFLTPVFIRTFWPASDVPVLCAAT